MVRKKRKGLCLTTRKVSTYRRSRQKISVQDTDTSATVHDLSDTDNISTIAYFMDSDEADETKHLFKIAENEMIPEYDLVWNSEDSGCKLIDGLYKIKWFDGPLVLEHVGGQIVEQVTVDVDESDNDLILKIFCKCLHSL